VKRHVSDVPYPAGLGAGWSLTPDAVGTGRPDAAKSLRRQRGAQG
jgi:hypothetical protein